MGRTAMGIISSRAQCNTLLAFEIGEKVFWLLLIFCFRDIEEIEIILIPFFLVYDLGLE